MPQPPSGLAVPKPHTVKGARMLRRTAVLVRTFAAAVNSVASSFLIMTPSARLRLAISLAWEQESPLVQSGTWSLIAVRKRIAGPLIAVGASSSDIDLNTIFSARALPDAYEMDSAAKMLRVDATLGTAGGINGRGNWTTEITWEPNCPIGDEELEKMFAGCQIIAKELAL